jgi:hypothetical protein
MVDEFYLEDEAEHLQEHFAVIYTPKRQRTRFPVNCVQVVDSEQNAIKTAADKNHFYPAKVVGPSRSSEGFRLYYLLRWLD